MGDGKISRAEFSNYVTGTTSNYVRPAAPVTTYSNAVAAPSYQYVQPQATSVFNAIDTNHDGKISRAEFANYVTGTTSNYVMPAAPVATYVQQQPAVSTVFNTIETTNYVKPAVAAPSYQYVQPQAQYA